MEDPLETKEVELKLEEVNLSGKLVVIEVEGVLVDAVFKEKGDVVRGITPKRRQQLVDEACPSDRDFSYMAEDDVKYIETVSALYFIRRDAQKMIQNLSEICQFAVFSCLPDIHVHAIVQECFRDVHPLFVWGRNRTHMRVIDDVRFLVKNINDVIDNFDINPSQEFSYDNVLLVGTQEEQCASDERNILILKQRPWSEHASTEEQIRARMSYPPRVNSCAIV